MVFDDFDGSYPQIPKHQNFISWFFYVYKSFYASQFPHTMGSKPMAPPGYATARQLRHLAPLQDAGAEAPQLLEERRTSGGRRQDMANPWRRNGQLCYGYS